MINFKAIGQRIKFHRKKNLYTQEQLAEKLNLSTEHLSRIENGTYRPSITLIEKLCNVFTINEAELMFGIASEKEYNKELYDKIELLSEEKKQIIIQLIELMQ